MDHIWFLASAALLISSGHVMHGKRLGVFELSCSIDHAVMMRKVKQRGVSVDFKSPRIRLELCFLSLRWTYWIWQVLRAHTRPEALRTYQFGSLFWNRDGHSA